MSKSSVVTAPRIYAPAPTKFKPRVVVNKPRVQVKPKARIKSQPFQFVWSEAAVKNSLIFVIGSITICILQLAVSTLLASNVYHIAELKRQAREMNIEYEILQSEIYALQSPQNLTNKAHELGMVHATTPAYLSIKTQKVMGVPTPAKGSTMVENLVPITNSNE